MVLVAVDYTNLSSGYVFGGRYEVVKALEKGSGGSVYLVKDLSVIARQVEAAQG